MIFAATESYGKGKDMKHDPSRKMADPVNHPAYYNQGGVECIDAIQAATEGLAGFEGFCTGSAIKYLWRWKRKGGPEDLRKARWFLDMLLHAAKAEPKEALAVPGPAFELAEDKADAFLADTDRSAIQKILKRVERRGS